LFHKTRKKFFNIAAEYFCNFIKNKLK
jgi:hypothetical protein